MSRAAGQPQLQFSRRMSAGQDREDEVGLRVSPGWKTGLQCCSRRFDPRCSYSYLDALKRLVSAEVFCTGIRIANAGGPQAIGST